MKKTTIVFLILLNIFSVACSTSKDSIGSNYNQIMDVEGIVFNIPSYVGTRATAISQIVDSSDYESNVIYCYKNGSDTYILFCMDELIIMANKGTTFNFYNTEKKEICLEKSALLNTWFTVSGKKFNYEEVEKNGIYKIIADVNAEVVITSNLYGDYCGKLAVINNGTEEWSLFVGAVASQVGQLSSEQLQLINNIVMSMEPYEKEDKTIEYETVVEQTLIEKEDLSNIVVPTEEIIEINSNEKKGLNVTNLKNRKIEKNKAYYSDAFNMLQLGQTGLFRCNYIGEEEQLIVRINKVLKEEETVSIIKQHVKNQTVYDYFDAPEGYHWEAIEYDISYENCSSKPYVNIKLRGLDGNKLVFRGVTIDDRTHDALSLNNSAGNCTYNNYCYYAIPNGCHEYALVIGDYNDSFQAYYYINN